MWNQHTKTYATTSILERKQKIQQKTHIHSPLRHCSGLRLSPTQKTIQQNGIERLLARNHQYAKMNIWLNETPNKRPRCPHEKGRHLRRNLIPKTLQHLLRYTHRKTRQHENIHNNLRGRYLPSIHRKKSNPSGATSHK